MKFGITQVKGGIAAILSKYNINRHAKTEVPFKFSKATFNLQPEDKVWLQLVKRKKIPNEEWTKLWLNKDFNDEKDLKNWEKILLFEFLISKLQKYEYTNYFLY